MKRLDQKVAIVTGAAKGIGRAIARVFAQEGASVIVADVDREAGERVEDEIRKAGGTALFFKVDVRDQDGAEEMALAAVQAYGRSTSCAPTPASFPKHPWRTWERKIGIGCWTST